jgi:hypothetical protein
MSPPPGRIVEQVLQFMVETYMSGYATRLCGEVAEGEGTFWSHTPSLTPTLPVQGSDLMRG